MPRSRAEDLQRLVQEYFEWILPESGPGYCLRPIPIQRAFYIIARALSSSWHPAAGTPRYSILLRPGQAACPPPLEPVRAIASFPGLALSMISLTTKVSNIGPDMAPASRASGLVHRVEVGAEPCIEEVEFRRLDHPLQGVAVPGLDETDDA